MKIKKALLLKIFTQITFGSKAVFSKDSFLRSLRNFYLVPVAVNHQKYGDSSQQKLLASSVRLKTLCFAPPDYSEFAFFARILLWKNKSVIILYKPWIKVLLEIKKFDCCIWNVPWTQKRDVIDVWLASEMYADMGKKKCGIVIANVAFCIISLPWVWNACNC